MASCLRRACTVRRKPGSQWETLAFALRGLLLGLGLLASAGASAQEPEPLSLDALIREVAARSPRIAAEVLRAEAMRGKLVAVLRKGLLPQVRIEEVS